MNSSLWIKLRAFFCFFLLQFNSSLFSKTNQAIYEDSFDQAAGGASLTRASQEAVLFANPALMPLGKKNLRWIGNQTSVVVGKDSLDKVRGLASGGGSSSDESTSDVIDEVFETPIHFGILSTISCITKNIGFTTLARFEPDISGDLYDDTGLPAIRARAEAYGGGVLGGGYMVKPWLSLGTSIKYLYKTEPDLSLSLADQAKITALQSDPKAFQTLAAPGTGMGYDFGAIVFLQGDALDFLVSAKVDDIGDTNFTGAQQAFPQLLHGGLGLTFHNSVDSLHLALDYRDITGVMGTSLPMRTYAGAKLILRNYVGIAAGLYQGYPSYGVRLDLILVKLGFTFYTREMGDYVTDDPRPLYVVTLGFGG